MAVLCKSSLQLSRACDRLCAKDVNFGKKIRRFCFENTSYRTPHIWRSPPMIIIIICGTNLQSMTIRRSKMTIFPSCHYIKLGIKIMMNMYEFRKCWNFVENIFHLGWGISHIIFYIITTSRYSAFHLIGFQVRHSVSFNRFVCNTFHTNYINVKQSNTKCEHFKQTNRFDNK